MRKQVGPKICIVFLLALVLIFAGCERKTPEVITDPEIKEESSVFSQTEPDNTEVQSALPETSDTSKPEKPTDLTQETDAENMELIMKIDGTEVSVAWENNESVDAIRELWQLPVDLRSICPCMEGLSRSVLSDRVFRAAMSRRLQKPEISFCTRGIRLSCFMVPIPGHIQGLAGLRIKRSRN